MTKQVKISSGFTTDWPRKRRKVLSAIPHFEIIELSNFTKGKQQNYYLKLLYVEITPVPKIIICIWFKELPGYNVSVLCGDI